MNKRDSQNASFCSRKLYVEDGAIQYYCRHCAVSKPQDGTVSESDKVLLPRKLNVGRSPIDNELGGFVVILVQLIRVNVIRVDGVVLVFAGHIFIFLRCSGFCTVSSILANLPCPVDMRQGALVLLAHARIGVIRALVDMPLQASSAFLAISQDAKRPTNWCPRRHPDVRIPALRVRTTPAKEMNAHG